MLLNVGRKYRMDTVDDAEGPLDPRIQIELENLNTATDVINKLEIELDEAHTAFGQLLSESTRRLTDIANKLGGNCIDRARCHYEALEVARQARVECQYQAQLFQRASEIHAAAKETVTLAEARFMSHQHEWNFDQAWQEMLNHATIKVMDAENKKAECGREHQRRATLCHDAELKVQQLEEKYRRSIIKSEPYFELKSQYDQMLATQKERVEYLQKAVKEAKRAYSSSFRALEEISNQIHQQRQDYDMVANGPREPGVGAELTSPESSLSYEDQMNKVSIVRLNSIASSSEPDIDDRAKDFDDVRQLQQRVDQLGGRSIDGSESFSSQWELELQASMEKLNNITVKKSTWSDTTNDTKDSDKCLTYPANQSNDYNSSEVETEKSLKNDQNEHKKLPMEFEIFKKFTPKSTTTSEHSQGWQSLTHSPINSILNRSKIAIRNSISKSLGNSPVNMSFSFSRSKVETPQSYNDTVKEQLQDDSWIQNSDKRISNARTSILNNSQHTKDNNRHKSFELNEPSEFKMPNELKSKPVENFEKQKVSSDIVHVQNDTVGANLGISSRSMNSTPVKTKKVLSRKSAAKFLDHSQEDFVKSQSSKNKNTKTSSVMELPLLSMFEASVTAAGMSKDKSCSMINLADEKRNFKAVLDNADLANIQAVSVERLASARHNIMDAAKNSYK